MAPGNAQVLCCVAAAIVVVIALQSGAVVQQQIKRSVCIDSEVHEEGMDIAGAARKLDGMLVTALVSISELGSSPSWAVLWC